MISKIIKRDGREVDFVPSKITEAVYKAAVACGGSNKDIAKYISDKVVCMYRTLHNNETPTVEEIQDLVEKVLIEEGHAQTAKSYILYRNERSRMREAKSDLTKVIKELTFSKSSDSDIKRENGNINADSSMGTMLKYGSSVSKDFYLKYLIDPEFSEAHNNGDIHIHDLDFYAMTTTCTQIDLDKLFKNGFSTGHGYLREPNDISSYAALACIAIQSNQNDQHGGQSIPKFDYDLAKGVAKTFKRRYTDNLIRGIVFKTNIDKEEISSVVKTIHDAIEKTFGLVPSLSEYDVFQSAEIQRLGLHGFKWEEPGKVGYHMFEMAELKDIQSRAYQLSVDETDRATYQAMEALIHNLNTMNSRAGCQTPFSSINYGTDTSPEGRMVIKNALLAQEAGLGHGETPIFPIHIFKVKEGVNFNPGDPNYDMFKLACRVSAKRLFPNFAFIDAPHNIQYYKQGNPDTEITYMGCRTRVIGNVNDPTREIVTGRGNLSFTSINLPRLAIEAKGDINKFFGLLDKMMYLVIAQLKHRFKIQCQKHVYNFPFLMGQGVWMDSEKLSDEDNLSEVLKHGTLSVGFIGLSECLVALIGKHHGESEEAQELGLKIIGHMREITDKEAEKTKLNFTLLATPAEGLSGRFVRIDKKKYGVIPGVTDKDYYTNSFHVTPSYDISAFDKIRIEAPYHTLTNAGHISYVEMDGDPTENLAAFEKVVRYMKQCGIGYGAINHPIDTDPVCGYTGIIKDECPHCGRKESDGGVCFERLRRITGYLTTTLDKWNDAKRAEEKDRVKHNT